MTYAQKLKDPRWQKKRLEILDRDDFKCQNCHTTTESLHVHHIAYTNGEPWEINADLLITLCENCHETETVELKKSSQNLISAVKSKSFNSKDINKFALLIEKMPIRHINDVQIAALEHALSNGQYIDKLIEEYFNHLKNLDTSEELTFND